MIETNNDPPEAILEKDIFERSVDAEVMQHGDMWLNVASYSSEIGRAEEVIAKTDYDIVPLAELCDDIWYPGRVARAWMENPDEELGAPYLSPTDLMYFKPQFRKREKPTESWVRLDYYDNPDDFFANEDDILVTRSGKIGRIMMATETITDYFLTDDLIRVETKDDTLEGYVYAYLDSWIGQAYIKQDEYGGWVDHIEPKTLENVPVIQLPEDEQQEIHDEVMEAYRKREEFLQDERNAVDRVGDGVLKGVDFEDDE